MSLDLINEHNIHNVRMQILQKKQSIPHFATIKQAGEVLTDYDSFPYRRWFRGVPESSKPIVAEREAGWRPRQDDCYKFNEPPNAREKICYPNHCFEAPCSTVFPCYSGYLKKYSDRDALNVQLNKACIVQYR